MHAAVPLRSRSIVALVVGGATLVASLGLSAMPAVAATDGVVSGTVTSKSTHAPLSDIRVGVYPAFDPVAPYQEPLDEVYTDGLGDYTLAALRPGNYRLLFEDLDYDYRATNGGYLDQYSGGAAGDVSDTTSVITVGSTDLDIDEQLTLGGVIKGTIVTSSGKPIKDMQVSAQLTSENDFYYDGPYTNHWTRTDSKGRYSFRGLGYDDYELSVQSYGTDYAPLTVPIGTLTEDARVRTLDPIVAPLGGSFRGAVTNSSGKPVAHVTVAIDIDADENMDESVFASTNSKGIFHLDGLPVGTYKPFVMKSRQSSFSREFLGGSRDPFLAKTITIARPGAVVTRDIRLSKAGRLTGVVRDASGARAKNIDVSASQSDAVEANYDDFATLGLTRTNARGEYSISDLAAGSYDATFGSEPTSAGAPVGKTPYVSASTVVVNATLAPTTKASGTVRSASGAPLASVDVYAIPADGDHCESTNFSSPYPSTRTSATGTYSLPLPDGTWVVKFSDSRNRVATRFLGGGTYPSDPLSTIIDTTDGASKRRDITLSATGATITGTPITAAGNTNAEGFAEFYRVVDGRYVDSKHWGECSYGEFGGSLADQFPLRGLADGDYELFLNPIAYVSHWKFPGTRVTFSIENGVLATVDGEPATNARSLGDIVLAEPVYVENPEAPEGPRPTIDAPEGLQVGKTVIANADAYNTEADYDEVQWLRNGRPIHGATGSDYQVQPGDAGAVLSFIFSGYSITDGVFISEVESEASGIVEAGPITVPENAPVVTGNGAVGNALTVASPTDAAPGSKFTYQWFINDSIITGATSKSFTPRVRDLDETLRIEVTTRTPGAGEPTTLSSASVTIVAGAAPELSTPKVLANGKATTGSKKKSAHYGTVLTSTAPSKPLEGLVISYQWQVNRGSAWSDLAGATTRTLTLPKKKTANAALGYRYRLVASAERSGYEAITPVASLSVTLTK